MFRKRSLRQLTIVLLLVAISFVGIVAAAAATTDRFYISRIIAWREADFHDFEKFPSHPVPAGANAFYFKPAPENPPEYLGATISQRPLDGTAGTVATARLGTWTPRRS